MKRGVVYAKLKEALGKDVHVGESDIEMCQRIIETGKKIWSSESASLTMPAGQS
jgi:hypothetical protein